MNKDPVTHCPVYKAEGCAHIDGYLCEVETCPIITKWVANKGTGVTLSKPQISPKDWPEDFNHDNGQYSCRCIHCKEQFIGYKRRVVCKECSKLEEE